MGHPNAVEDAPVSPRTFPANLPSLFALFVLTLSCGKSYEYRDEGGVRCCNLTVPAGNSSATIEARVPADHGGLFESAYPGLDIEFVCPAADAFRLEKMDASLEVDGVLIQPDDVQMTGGYFDAFTSDKFPQAISPDECCKRLDLRIENKAAFYTGDYGPIRFGVRLRKQYASLHRLPEKMILIVDVTTDRGVFRQRRSVSLTQYESNAAPFRIH